MKQNNRRTGIRALEVVLVTLFLICQILGGVTFTSNDSVKSAIAPSAKETDTGISVKQMMTDRGFYAENVTAELNDSSLVSSYWFSNINYSVEYYEFADSMEAQLKYNTSLSYFTDNFRFAGESSAKANSFIYSVFTDEKMCYFLVWKDRVFIYSEAAMEFKDEITDLFVELGLGSGEGA